MVEHAGQQTSVPFDRVLVAVGRRAASDGLAEAGIALNPNGTVQVDAYLRTTLDTVSMPVVTLRVPTSSRTWRRIKLGTRRSTRWRRRFGSSRSTTR